MNNSKTKIIVRGSRYKLSKLQYDHLLVNDAEVSFLNYVKYLGVTFDKNMQLTKQIDLKWKTAFGQLYKIRKLRNHLSFQSCHTLIHTLVISHLDYANSLYIGLPQSLLNKLQRVQNSAVRVLFNKPKFSHVTMLLKEVHWLPISYRIKFKILTITFNALNGISPSYIKDLLIVKKSIITLDRLHIQTSCSRNS